MSMYNNSAERVEAMFDCVMPKERSDIPYYPQLDHLGGQSCRGHTGRNDPR